MDPNINQTQVTSDLDISQPVPVSQPVSMPIQPQKNNSKWVIVVVIIILILGGGYFAYTKFMNKDNDLQTEQSSVLNDKASIILTKEFNYPSEKPATIHTLPHQIGGAISYRIFINNKLIEDGQPKFGSAGSRPLSTSIFKNGINTLRVEVDPHPEIGVFDKNTACDIAIIGANEGDISSTMIEENENILARATCTTFPGISFEQQKNIQEKITDNQQDKTILTIKEKEQIKLSFIKVKNIYATKDITVLRKYFVDQGNTEDEINEIMSKDKEKALKEMEIINLMFLPELSVDQILENKDIKWFKGSYEDNSPYVEISFYTDNPLGKGKGVMTYTFYYEYERDSWYWAENLFSPDFKSF